MNVSAEERRELLAALVLVLSTAKDEQTQQAAQGLLLKHASFLLNPPMVVTPGGPSANHRPGEIYYTEDR